MNGMAMARVAAAARARADALRDDVRAAAEALPGIKGRIEGGDVVLSGRGLAERWPMPTGWPGMPAR